MVSAETLSLQVDSRKLAYVPPQSSVHKFTKAFLSAIVLLAVGPNTVMRLAPHSWALGSVAIKAAWSSKEHLWIGGATVSVRGRTVGSVCDTPTWSTVEHSSSNKALCMFKSGFQLSCSFQISLAAEFTACSWLWGQPLYTGSYIRLAWHHLMWDLTSIVLTDTKWLSVKVLIRISSLTWAYHVLPTS